MINLAIIYGKLSEFLPEKISVGIVIFNDECIDIEISEDKLMLFKKYVGESKYNIIRKFIKEFDNYYKSKAKSKISLFNSIDFSKDLEDANLKINNSIEISEVEKLSVDFNDVTLSNLKKIYLYNNYPIDSHGTRIFLRKRNLFLKSVEKHIDKQYNFTSQLIKEIKIPVPVTFAGKNGSIYAGSFIPNSIDVDPLKYKIGSLLDLSEKIYKIDNDSKFYIISNIDFKSKKFKSLDFINNFDSLKFIPSEDYYLNELSNIIIHNNVRPITSYSFNNN